MTDNNDKKVAATLIKNTIPWIKLNIEGPSPHQIIKEICDG